ncbi:alpha/beta hydrolase [Streptomyces sp. NPDC048636]|uniref:alpha/beta hydrolase family protein n=1 Tax=Streptomyces sp. NPDC048636 TaxID=3155762 RepID=UPI0034365DF2
MSFRNVIDGESGGVGRRAVTTSAVLATAALLSGGGGAARARAAGRGGGLTVRLPAPTGPHRIGVTTLYLVDRTRRDPWNARIPVREVMVTAWYPARDGHDRPPARHMTARAARSFGEMAPLLRPGLPAEGVDWAATRAHAYIDAPARRAPCPVLLYSPGGGDPRTLGTGLAEDLASHGFVVVAVDHPGDASEVVFPRPAAYRRKLLRRTVFRGDPRMDTHQFHTAIATRIADTRFVLDRLTALAAGHHPDAERRPLPAGLPGLLDLERVGVYGHSAGGTTAAETLYQDRRIAAAVNLEGFLDEAPSAPDRPGELLPVARHGTDRPLLLLQTDGFTERAALERSWSALLARSRGCATRAGLDDAAHWVFTDYAALVPRIQTAGLMSVAARTRLIGAADPVCSVPAVRERVRAFFTRQLPRR